jgi:hypothetical protein
MESATDTDKFLNSPSQGFETVPDELSAPANSKKKVQCLEKFSSNFF